MDKLPVQVWKFLDFVEEDGTNRIEEWRQELSEDARLQFDAILEQDCKTAQFMDWLSFKRFMKGECREWKIWELQFSADGREYRVFGIFGPNRREATLLAGCYHKGRVYTPPNALETAIKRCKLLAQGRAGRDERQIDLAK